jgi:hypothetical protein
MIVFQLSRRTQWLVTNSSRCDTIFTQSKNQLQVLIQRQTEAMALTLLPGTSNRIRSLNVKNQAK